ncbi:hypothetical protein Hypma_005812 [Hypsizygus marmoreus]|uniref:Uncharacterized protein n=1 Tax=Hypsizygus marmoreus TaxID=39966 RepID=A0A369KB07_HYPMA|nr:hypothetical protein Hypma_005812 [Hypsizygus marmoreus]
MPVENESALEAFLDQVKKDIGDELNLMSTSPHRRIHHAQNIVESLAARVEAFGTFMENVQETHAWLLHQQNEAEERLSDLDTPITSPVRRLSRELISQILDHFAGTEDYALLSTREHKPDTPLILGQICSRWREVALSTPRLWSSLHVKFPHNIQVTDEESIVGLVHLWMERSGDAPLMLRLTIYSPAGRPLGLRSDSIRAIFAPLLQHSHRWESLHLDLSFGALKSLMREKPFASSLQAPLLQSFELTGGRDSQDALRLGTRPSYHLPFDFSSAPRLQKISLFHVGLCGAYESAFPWQQINELYLVGLDHEVSFEDCMAIL